MKWDGLGEVLGHIKGRQGEGVPGRWGPWIREGKREKGRKF